MRSNCKQNTFAAKEKQESQAGCFPSSCYMVMNTNLFDKDIENALRVLTDGGTILYPTDTIWGIGCDATNEEAVERIIALKERPANKSFVVLVADERDILQYVAAPDLSVFEYLQQTNKPTTVIYGGAIGLAPNVLADDGSIAIRICKEPYCRHLIRRLRKPIVSTSANLSGQPSPQLFSDINEKMIKGVDYTAVYRRDDLNKAGPSSIIRWTDGSPVIIRE